MKPQFGLLRKESFYLVEVGPIRTGSTPAPAPGIGELIDQLIGYSASRLPNNPPNTGTGLLIFRNMNAL